MPHHPGDPSGRQVFEILAREHADMLTAYLRSLLPSTADVDDVFQETMIVAWRRLDDFDRSRPFGPWLRGIAARLAMAHRRKSVRGPVAVEPGVIEALDRRFDDIASLPGDSFRDRINRLTACLEKLPELMRKTVELAYAKDMLLKQVAAALDSTEEAVKKRIQRSRKLLLDCMLTGEVTP